MNLLFTKNPYAWQTEKLLTCQITDGIGVFFSLEFFKQNNIKYPMFKY